MDYIIIDTEHNPFGAEALDYIPVLCRMRGCAPMIRVAWNDPALIKKAYDVGAVAVMVPQVDTAEEAARAAGMREIFLYAQTHATSFYEGAGFSASGGIFMDAHIPHRQMFKLLT